MIADGVSRTCLGRALVRSIVLALVTAAGAACRQDQPSLVLATTTSIVNSGLLEQVLPLYESATSTRLQTLPVGSGRAIRLLELGQADVVISHAPRQEAEALEKHPDWRYRKVLYNDFLIAGPAGDPAGVAAAADARDALRRIAASEATWVSRGDQSGTHEREQELWRDSAATVEQHRTVTSGQGMGATLRVADQLSAYTITDRGTFQQLQPRLTLNALYGGDRRLLNTYAVLTRESSPRGIDFARWLSEGGGRKALERLDATGALRGFEVWPADRPGTRPDARPF